MTIRFGVIGAGMIGRDHARRITDTLTGGEIVAVNDVNPDQAHALVENLKLDAKIYDSGQDLIKAKNVDVVLVTSWGPTHEEFVLAAIAVGKYVFCEKPLATTAEACKRIVDAEIVAGKRLVQVGFMRRYDTGYRLLKMALDEGQIGEPLMLHCAHRMPEVNESYTTEMAMYDTLIHELDVLRWLLNDDFKSVQVVFPRRTRYAHSNLADPQIVLMETNRGVRIDVEIFVNCKYGYDIQCSVVGEEGIAILPEPQSLQVRQEAKLSTSILTDWQKRFAAAYDTELQEFINAVHGDVLIGPAAWDGHAVAIVSDACVKAQQSGQIESIVMPKCPALYK